MTASAQTVECEACGWQGRRQQTDSGHCPDCKGQCLELAAIYGAEAADAETDAGSQS